MTKVYLQSFEKGMNKDMNAESVQGQYFDLQNFRLFTSGNNTVGGLSNVPGTKYLFDLPADHVIIGSCNIRDLIVIFTTNDTSEEGGQGWIYTFSVTKDTQELKTPLTLKYTNTDLGFTTKHPIEAHGHFENTNKQFVYFSDFFKDTGCINIATVQLSDPIESVYMFVNSDLPQPEITDILSGGSLKAGLYEIAVKLTTFDGKESLYCPNSKQVHIVIKEEDRNNSHDYFGLDTIDTNGDAVITSKSIRVTFNTGVLPTNLFKTATFISIFKNTANQIPVISTIETVDINFNSKISIIYTGNEQGSEELAYEDYLLNSHPFYTNKTFTILKSQLTVSNIKTSRFTLDWDTRTVRYRLKTGVLLNNLEYTGNIYNNPFNDESGQANGYRPLGTYSDYVSEDQFIYQSDGVTLGGESLDQSVKYKFILETIDGDVSDDYKNQATINPNSENSRTYNGKVIVNKYFEDYNSPLLRSLAQYKRGEVYRFGIIASKNGRISFVNFTGDIKFPEISTEAGFDTLTGITNYPIATFDTDTTYLHPLGIQFEITIPENLDIDSIQIVRVPRTEDFKTRICQGVISKWFTHASFNGIHYPMSNINDIEQYYATGTETEETSGGGTIQWQNLQSVTDRRDLVSLFTPEASYELFYPKKQDIDYLKVVGYYTDTIRDNQGASDTPVSALGPRGWGENILVAAGPDYIPLSGNAGSRLLTYTKARSTSALADYTASYQWAKIQNAQLHNGFYGNDDNPVLFETFKIRNYGFEQGQTSSANQGAYSGTALITRLEGGNIDHFDDSGTSIYRIGDADKPFEDWRGQAFIIDYVRKLSEQYGGIGEASLQYNTFIPVSAPIKTSGTYNIFNGDTYISFFNFMKNYWDNAEDNESFFESVLMPVETNLNLELAHGRTFIEDTGGFDHDADGTYENYRSQETGNRNGDMFTYNDLFSEGLMSRPYFTKPLVFEENTSFDVRTYLSNNKINGEEINAWCKYAINSFKDVDASFGQINRTHYYMNQLFFLQDTAVGYVSINPRAVVGTGDGVPTKLGTAEGFDDYNYISTNKGSIHQRASQVVDHNLFFYDGINRKFCMLQGSQEITLSEVRGMDSWFRSLKGFSLLTKDEGGDNPLEFKGVHLAYDQENKEVYISVLGDLVVANSGLLKDDPNTFYAGDVVEYDGNYYQITDEFTPSDYSTLLQLQAGLAQHSITITLLDLSYTLVYSNLFNVFQGFYSFTPYCYLNDNNYILSPNNDKVHIHNYGLPCDFYGTDYNSSIRFLMNGDPLFNKILQDLEYDLTVKDYNSGSYIQNVGLNTINIQNDYQASGNVSLTNRQKNRFRKWRIKIPRDINSSNNLARFRGNFHDIELTYDNSTTYLINLERILVNYVPQIY